MSKLNPQKAVAYVGPGVLKQGGKITKVPNGPLIKKKGPFKGSTLKSGGKVKKAQGGGGMDIMGMVGGLMGGGGSGGDDKKQKEKEAAEAKAKAVNDMIGGVVKNSNNLVKNNRFSNNMSAKSGKTIKKKAKSGSTIKKAQNSEYLTKEGNIYTTTKKVNTNNGPRYYQGKSPSMSFSMAQANDKARKINDSIPKKNLTLRALEVMNQKNGGMLKRADGSYSKRGLWDNIRANKGSGKKPTKQMLVQEKKIKAKSKK
jgi:hypothetical protein